MRSWFTWIALVAISSTAFAQDAGKSVQLPGRLDSVTVYRGQALVARLVDVPAPGGLREVVVTDLPVQVVPSSLFAESVEGAEVRSVLFRERAVSQDVREAVRKFDEQIRAAQDEQAANQRAMQTLAEQKVYMDKLQGFIAPTAQTEMSKGVLNAETLKTLTAFQFEQRASIAAGELKLAKEGRDLGEKLAILQRQREELNGGSGKTVREAVVFANFPANGGKLRVRYLVNGATWSPSYNVRGEAGAKQATLEYNASVQQQSGEDWGDVQMTLSTATPSLVAMGPTLNPLAISLTALSRAQAGGGGAGEDLDYSAGKKQLKDKLSAVNSQRNIDNNGYTQLRDRSYSISGVMTPITKPGEQGEQLDRKLNELADDLQMFEFRANVTRDRSGIATMPTETVSVTYQLANRTSLPSRPDTQLIQVAAMPMTAEFYKIAVPVLSSYVYDQATLTNDGKMVLLAGPMASYWGGQFVGGGQIPTVAIGETFDVGFGIDSSLRATRELVAKTDSMQGGNKVLNFSYHLTVENFGTTAAVVRVMDRQPTSKDNDVKVTLVSSSKEVSDDALYQQRELKKGMLRWDLPVAAQSINGKAAVVDYQLKLEYDRQMTITGMPVAQK